MDNANIILDQENPQSREEDEELEEQRRRQEELADLLADGIHAFNYDESTLNSSVSSIEPPEPVSEQEPSKNILQFNYDESKNVSLDNIVQNYRNVLPEDQLKMLYDVRVREINSLKEEFNQYKNDKNQEISNLKTKLTLGEAEIRHLQLSVKNLEGLLVDKTSVIKNLKETVVNKDDEILKLKNNIEKMKMELISYTSTINELQLKLSDNNPFTFNKNVQSDELQKVQQDQISKLEMLLEEQVKKVELLEKEKKNFDQEFKKLLESKKEADNENNYTIQELSKKLQNYQEECRNLYSLGEAIKKESDHYKERLSQMETSKIDLLSESLKHKSIDKETLLLNQEKLKRMLLDKDLELSTLRAKLKFYNSDIDELLHYRQILSNVHSTEIKHCNNSEHGELLIFMQRQIQSYQQAVEDRNQQIQNLNSVNKELQEKIEEMIQKTRTEIQNLSQKYSLPKLETMSNELKNAEITINELKKLLEAKTLENDKLVCKLKELQEKVDVPLTSHDNNEKINRLQNLVEILQKTNEDLKRNEASLIERIEEQKIKLNEFLINNKNEVHLPENQSQKIEELTNVKTMMEAEKFALKLEVKRISDELEQLQKKNETLSTENEKNITQIRKLTNDLEERKSFVKIIESTKVDLEKQLEAVQQQLNEAKTEIIQIQKEKDELSGHNVRRSLINELKDVENTLNNRNRVSDDLIKSDLFQQCLQAELLKAELLVRDQIQQESLNNIKKIETHYQSILMQKLEVFKKEKERWQSQETAFRNYFASILDECGKKMIVLEDDNLKLSQDIKTVIREYENYKQQMIAFAIKYQNVISNLKKYIETMSNKWEGVLEYSVKHYSSISKQSSKNIKKVMSKIKTDQLTVDLIEASYAKRALELKNQMLRKLK